MSDLFREFPEQGLAVVLDGSGNVLRQLVAFERLPSGRTKFRDYSAPLCYPTKIRAKAAARQMGFPVANVTKGQSLIGDFYFIKYDPRYDYALACW